MKVAFYQDLNIFAVGGGAQLSDQSVFMEGIKRGHDVKLVLPETFNAIDTSKFDLAIISNAVRFSREQLQKITQIPYVMYIHDYFPLCRYRLFFPAVDRCKKCVNKEFATDLLTRSALNIFLSPAHKNLWAKIIPEVKQHPSYLHPSPIDVEMFKPLDVPRKVNSVIGVNVLLPFKGSANIIDYAEKHPEMSFTFVGGMEGNIQLPPNCKFIGPMPYEKLPELYSQSEYCIHLPSSVDPFCRVVAEAYLSGSKLIVNKNVGATSYKWFKSREQVKKHVSESPKRFWREIEKVIA